MACGIEQHDFIPDMDSVHRECLCCGCEEIDGEPWLPCHFVPEGWE